MYFRLVGVSARSRGSRHSRGTNFYGPLPVGIRGSRHQTSTTARSTRCDPGLDKHRSGDIDRADPGVPHTLMARRSWMSSPRSAPPPGCGSVTRRTVSLRTCCPAAPPMLYQGPLSRHLRRHRREPSACVHVPADGLLSSVPCTTWRPCSTSGCRRTSDRHQGPTGLAEARCRTWSTGLPPTAGDGCAAWPSMVSRRRTRSDRELFGSRLQARRHNCGRHHGCLPRRLSADIGLSASTGLSRIRARDHRCRLVRRGHRRAAWHGYRRGARRASRPSGTSRLPEACWRRVAGS